MLKTLFKRSTLQKDNIHAYFKDAYSDIEESNLSVLMILSVFSVSAIVLFSGITMYLLPKWKPSQYHYLFLALMLIFTLIAYLANNAKHKHRHTEKIVCGCFVLMVGIFLSILDTVPSPSKGQIFMSIFMVTAPVLFIVSHEVMIIFQSVFVVYFIIMSYHFKPDSIAHVDTLSIVLGYVVGFVIYGIVMNIRVNEFIQKKEYKLSSEIDALTGVTNRAECKRRIDIALESKQTDDLCAFLIFDVDNFKQINDTLGHSGGDEVLVEIANILKATFRKKDVIGRFGGDEFIVFVNDFENREFLRTKCINIENRMRSILAGRFEISCSTGVCVLNQGEATLEKIFKVADEALYEAKTFRKGRHIIHTYSGETSREDMPIMVVVDDNDVDREIVAVQFDDDFRVEKFENGENALKYLYTNLEEVSVIILDMMLPEMSGLDVLRTLRGRKETADIPVIVISSDHMTEENALLEGADDMISKPIVPAIIKLRVKNAMRKR